MIISFLVTISFTYIILPKSFASISIPETVVELSIYDLIKKGPRKYRLPKDYGDLVAKLIVKQEEALTNCLTKKKNHKKVFAYISINQKGLAQVKLENNKQNNDQTEICIMKELSGIIYPKHKLKKNVSVKLPLDIKLNIL